MDFDCASCLSAEVEFNVSGMFTAPSHQTSHPTTPVPMDPETPPTLERRRPGSFTGPPEGGSGGGGGETPRKDRYPSQPRLRRQDSQPSASVSALYTVANESIVVRETLASPESHV